MQDFTSLNIIFIIAAGVLTFVILFIFAKRQITRFALRSRRGPHVPIGADAKKVNIHLKSLSKTRYLVKKFKYLTEFFLDCNTN